MTTRVLVTGGAGFIGSALVRRLVLERNSEVCTIDKLTYSGSLDNLVDVADQPRHHFRQIDICDVVALRAAVLDFAPDAIVHLAAESHVDRSIDRPSAFIETNIVGTYHLLEIAREYAACEARRVSPVARIDRRGLRQLGTVGAVHRRQPVQAELAVLSIEGQRRSSRARMVRDLPSAGARHELFEQLRPVSVSGKADSADDPEGVERTTVPVYGDGMQVRDWLHVDDHVSGLVSVFEQGAPGQTYNIGGNSERTNLAVVETILRALARRTGKREQELLGLIRFVTDRPGHDRRYAIDASRMRDQLGWAPRTEFAEGIDATVGWYVDNLSWCERRSNVYSGQRLGVA